MPEAPLISIITVTFNAQATIECTINSVDNQVGLSRVSDFEHIVMDGNSSDATLDILSLHDAPHRQVVSEPDKGIYDAMNKALDLARGKYLIFLNAGDAFHSSDTLVKIKQAIISNDYPGIVYGQTNLVDKEGNFMAPRHLTAPRKLTYESFAQGMTVCHQAFVVLARIAPHYDKRYRFSADYDWCIQCLQHSRHNVYLPDVMIDYLSEGVTTANRFKSLRERYRIMCFYYGFCQTTLRHIKFLFRYLHNKTQIKNIKTSKPS